MTAPQFRQRIRDFVCGDSLRIERTILSLPTGLTVSKAWLTIKTLATDLDAAATLQLSITSTLSSAGQITDVGTTSGDGALRFTLTPAQTLLLTPEQEYVFDVQVLLSDGGIYTPVKGTIEGLQQITIATS
jgi:hypothetical protein